MKQYRLPFNYLEYVKDFDPDAHVRVFKIAVKTNSETFDAKIVNIFNLPSKILCLTGVTIIWEITQITLLQNFSDHFVKGIEKFKMMNKFTYS